MLVRFVSVPAADGKQVIVTVALLRARIVPIERFTREGQVGRAAESETRKGTDRGYRRGHSETQEIASSDQGPVREDLVPDISPTAVRVEIDPRIEESVAGRHHRKACRLAREHR